MGGESAPDVAAFWNGNADVWTQDVRAGFDTYRDLFTFPAFLDFLPPLAGLTAVDFGCGEGTNTRAFARLGARMSGVDVSERMIAHAHAAEAAEPLGIDYRTASYSADTSLPEGGFDAVLSTMALMDGPDLAGAMREAHRLLRPGGFLTFSVLHPCFITPGLSWIRDADGRTTGLGVGRYFERESFVESWRFGDRPAGDPVEPFAVPRFPRTIGDYLNAVIGAGLTLTRVAEPQPDARACAAAATFARWRDIAAFVLLVEARRPA